MSFIQITPIGTIDILIDKPETGDVDEFVTKMESAFTKLQNYMNSLSTSVDSINACGQSVETQITDTANLAATVNVQATNLQLQLDAYNAINGISGTDLGQLGADIDALVAASGGVVATTGNQNIGGVKTFENNTNFEGTLSLNALAGLNKRINFNVDNVEQARIQYVSASDSLYIGNIGSSTFTSAIRFAATHAVMTGELRAASSTDGLSNALSFTTKDYVDSLSSAFNGGTITADLTVRRADAGQNSILTVESPVKNAYLILNSAATFDPLVDFKRDGVRRALIYDNNSTGSLKLRKYAANGTTVVTELNINDDGTIKTVNPIHAATPTSASDGDMVATKDYVDNNAGAIDYVHESGGYALQPGRWVTGHFDSTGSNATTWNDSAGTGSSPVIADEWKLIGVPFFKGDILDFLSVQCRCNSNNISELEYQVRFVHADPVSDYLSGAFGSGDVNVIDVVDGNFFHPPSGDQWSGLSGRLFRRTIDINYTAPEDGVILLYVAPTMINGQANDIANFRQTWKIQRAGTPTY